MSAVYFCQLCPQHIAVIVVLSQHQIAAKRAASLTANTVYNGNAIFSVCFCAAIIPSGCRRATGILGVLSVADNISIASLDALRKGPIMLDNKKILDLVATNKEKMAIKVPSPKTQIKSLSGGNQQKVLIARWLANNPDVLILDEPTRGIDVGAKYEIYCIIADLAKQGKSIIMISSEMSEIIGMSNRVMVMCDGRITGFINGKDATQENIMALATQFETAPDTAAANQ